MVQVGASGVGNALPGVPNSDAKQNQARLLFGVAGLLS
jgi:hypothetical protein